MLKREKEVIQAQLDAEKATLKEIEKQYQKALEDIDDKIAILLGRNDADLQNVIYQVSYQRQLKTQVQAILEQLQADEFATISEFLTYSYQNGYVGAAYSMFGQGVPVIVPIDPKAVVKAIQTDSQLKTDLYTELGVDVTKMKKSISSEITRGIASGQSYSQIAENISKTTKAPLSRVKNIVETESHRINQAASYDASKAAKSKGADVLRQWNSTLDGATRPTHRRLDGQIREMDEPFEMDGKKAMYPGDFGDPAEDCRCRCQLLQRARWALGSIELKSLKDRAEFYGLDKTEDFKDFEKKFIKAAETIENSDKSGIIISEKQFGKKVGKHASDFGLDPSSATDRVAFIETINNIVRNNDEVLEGTWRSQPGPVNFFIKGRDVVVTNQNGEFITILKGGINNARVKNARNK